MDWLTPLRDLIGHDLRLSQEGSEDEPATVNGVSVELYLTPEAKVRLQVEMLDGFEYTLMTDADLREVKEMLPAADLFPLPLWDAAVTLAWEEPRAPLALPGHRSRQSDLAQVTPSDRESKNRLDDSFA